MLMRSASDAYGTMEQSDVTPSLNVMRCDLRLRELWLSRADAIALRARAIEQSRTFGERRHVSVDLPIRHSSSSNDEGDTSTTSSRLTFGDVDDRSYRVMRLR
jgi:hypothetical protein